MTEYAELHAHSYFSLLDGTSSPELLVETAAQLGLRALALTDHDSLAGAVRFMQAAKRAGVHGIIGAEVTLLDARTPNDARPEGTRAPQGVAARTRGETGYHLTLLAETQAGYANLCRLITASRLDHLAPDDAAPWMGKIDPVLSWERLAQHTGGLIALTGCARGPVAAPLLQGDEAAARQTLLQLRDLFGPDHLYVELQHHCRPADEWRNHALCDLAHDLVLPVVATQNVHYAARRGSRLHDAMIAIRHLETLDEARRAGRLPNNSNAYLHGPAEMARLFQARPDAVANTVRIAERCQTTLDFSARRLPHFATPDGSSEFAYLYELCHANLPRRYPDLRPQVLKQLAHELDIIERAGLAGYFLIVWDIMRFAREQGIRGQGRGSAANSIVAYLLQITNIDPLQHHLLFERFLSEDKFTAPDIDLDFDTSRRDEVIHYVYDKYGRDHTAMVTNYVTYQARSALRDLAKVLDFPTQVIDGLAKRLDTFSATGAAADLMTLVQHEEEADPAGADLAQHPLALLADLMQQIDGAPRHLGIHSGGMLITGPRLDEVVPQEPATMPGRIIVQWDKDSVEDAGLIKIDLLGLGMLGLMSKCVEMVAARGGTVPDLWTLPLDDPAIYAAMQRGDTIGAFQVESRAQQQMLPRLKPACFEDIIVAVAIIRPGPIQGNMVHPFFRRRHGLEAVSYWHPKLEPVLQETLGVMLFQEQVLKTAMVLAGFSAGEADLLRRALSRSKPGPEMEMLRARFIEGAAHQEIDVATANSVFDQLAGYAGYGFCKSHSASFALIAYQSLWLRHYYPAEFYCALLNSQPMGFYSPEVILGDARRHGLDVLPPDIHVSAWEYTVEHGARPALRTGLVAVKGMGEAAYARVDAARQAAPFTGLRDLLGRTHLPKSLLENLIRAGALDAMAGVPTARRDLLWQLGALEEPYPQDAPGLDLPVPVVEVALPHLEGLQQTVWEYELLGHSPDGQILRHYRAALHSAGVWRNWQVKHAAKHAQWVWVAGMVVVRQRPQTAKGIMFLSLEDESGLLDLVVKPDVYPLVRPVLQTTMLILAGGVVQKGDGGVTSVLVQSCRSLLDTQK